MMTRDENLHWRGGHWGRRIL